MCTVKFFHNFRSNYVHKRRLGEKKTTNLIQTNKEKMHHSELSIKKMCITVSWQKFHALVLSFHPFKDIGISSNIKRK